MMLHKFYHDQLVAMVTKFETKGAITQLVWDNITEMLAPSRVIGSLWTPHA